MRHESQANPTSGRTRRLAAATGLALALLIPLAGCTLKVSSDGGITLGEAFSNLGQAGENAWDDIVNWFDERF